MSSSVKKRETFYLAGYDPRGARHYYNLYKKEATLQSEVNDIEMEVSSRKKVSPFIYKWKINTSATQTNYHFLGYDDFIKKGWRKSTYALLIDLWLYFKTYFLSGVFFKLSKASPPQTIPLLYPVVYLISSLLISLLILYVFTYLLTFYLPIYLSIVVSLYFSYKLLTLLISFGEKVNVFWLLRIYVFSLKYSQDKIENLEQRIDTFVTYIEKEIDSDTDEILLVAHSVGTILLVPVLSKLLSNSRLTKKGINKISILTLGQCIPLVSFLPNFTKFKNELLDISKHNELCWLDYTSIADGACFPFINYFDNVNNNFSPKYLSPRFHLLYNKKNYNKLKKDKFTFHFLYIMSTDYEGKYDFFKMTAGNERLHTVEGIK